MSVRFILGRAGTGKTFRCLQAIRARLDADPATGPKLILLVPEQASLQMERALLAEPGPGATHRAEVLSFRRLAYRVLQTAGPSGRRALTEQGRAMVLWHLVGSLAPQLSYYRRAERFGGFAQSLSATVAELIDEAVAPPELVVGAAHGDDDPLRSRRLGDLRVIYEAYLNYLGSDRLDPAQHLMLARERLHLCPWVHGAEVWMDGFAGLTRQEILTLAVLARLAQHVDITVMCDPAKIADGSTSGLYDRTLRTYQELSASLAAQGASIDDPIHLQPSPIPRFTDSHPLQILESRIFGDSPIDSPTSEEVGHPSAITVAELPDRRVEVEYAVSKVCEWVQRAERSMRYREIALIVRDLGPYYELLAAALADRNIPYFIDRRRSTTHHPLVEFIRGLVAVCAEDFSVESVRMLLKTGLLGLEDDDADALENYLLAYGVQGSALWRGEDWNFRRLSEKPDAEVSLAVDLDVATVNRARRWVFGRIESFHTFATTDTGRTGREWAEALAKVIEAFDIRRQLEDWAGFADEDGDLDQAEEHRQILRDATAFLGDLNDSLGEKSLSLGGLSAVLEAGLSQFTLGLAPPMLDQLMVGSIERSRHPEVRAVILLGFSESSFPHVPREDSILTDEDRRFLADHSRPIGRSRAEQVLDDRLLLYTAVTRPSEELVITYPAATEDGKALPPSPYLADVLMACPGLSVTKIADPRWSRETWNVWTPTDLAEQMTSEFATRPADDDRSPSGPPLSPLIKGGMRRAVWNELYERARKQDDLRGTLRNALTALAYRNVSRLSPGSIEKVISDPFHASVSRLETFAACPFKHFAQYELRLSERVVAELQAVDVGKLHHAVLEDFVNGLIARQGGLSDLDDAAVVDALAASCQRVGLHPLREGTLSTARETYMLRRAAVALARVLRSQRLVSGAGAPRPKATEVRFGFAEGGGLPGLDIETPRGRRVILRGVIDRVDLAELADEMLGVVVDYKLYRAKEPKLNLSEVFHGLSLQLLGYLLVLAQHGATLGGRRVRPVGAFYVSLRERYKLVDHPNEAPDADQERKSVHRPRGIVNADDFAVLERDYADGSWSRHYNVYKNASGQLKNIDRSDAGGGSDFRALLEHTRRKLGELADGILDGDVSVRPYRLSGFSPCSWCAFGGLCRFEFAQGEMRFLESLKRSDVFKRINVETPRRGG